MNDFHYFLKYILDENCKGLAKHVINKADYLLFWGMGMGNFIILESNKFDFFIKFANAGKMTYQIQFLILVN